MGTYMESWVNSLTYYRRRSLFLFEVKHMNASRYFRRYFSSNRLKNISRSSYIINADRYSFEEKAEILSEIYNQRNFNKNDALTVDSLFKATMFKEVQRLEYDIQNFS